MPARYSGPRRGPGAAPSFAGRKVLNKVLYGLLCDRVGPVVVCNEGEAAGLAAPSYSHARKRTEASFRNLGEYYACSCPYCNDTRHRLWVNHLWCTPDPYNGKPLWNLARCYNEDCLATRYGDFERLVFDRENSGVYEMRQRQKLMQVEPGVETDPDDLRTAVMPGECTPLGELPRSHPARVYLSDRGFDPVELSQRWGVAVCVKPSDMLHAVKDRIVVPVVYEGRMVGWQARYVGDVNWKAAGVPKYYNLPAFKKSLLLYNHDLAAELSPELVVVVEGVTDVWAGGPSFVSTLGKTVSSHQRTLLSGWAARDGLLVLMFDPGAWTTEVRDKARAREKHDRLLADLGSDFDGRVAEVVLPDGKDPGKFSRETLREVVKAAVKDAGFDPRKYKAVTRN